MGMEGSGLSVADALALQDRNNNGMFGGDGGLWVFFLFFLLAWGGGSGFGFGGNGAVANYATQADIQRGFDTNTIVSKLDGISNGLCNVGYENAQLANQTQAAIANLGYQTQACCCETNRNIDAVRYENAKNTCDIITAANANTQRIIDMMTQNTIQELRDNLQAAQLQLGNVSQTQTIINAVRPFPTPSYITCSPYTAANGFGACGCGC